MGRCQVDRKGRGREEGRGGGGGGDGCREVMRTQTGAVTVESEPKRKDHPRQTPPPPARQAPWEDAYFFFGILPEGEPKNGQSRPETRDGTPCCKPRGRHHRPLAWGQTRRLRKRKLPRDEGASSFKAPFQPGARLKAAPGPPNSPFRMQQEKPPRAYVKYKDMTGRLYFV